MRWREGRRSDNIEDTRGSGGGFGGMGGGGMKFGLGGLVVLAAAYFLGVDPRLLMGLLDSGGGAPAEQTNVQSSAPQDEAGDFVSVVLADTEDTWSAVFRERGASYRPPRLRLFSRGVQSGCGVASTAAGPFYCPADQHVYLDTDFFQELEQRFQAPGDFARAYVIAHEVGHHVQNLLGTADRVQAARERADDRQSNALQVRMELQADCYAGVWAFHANRARNIIEAGDVDAALGAAAAVGDDRIQRQTQGYVRPDTFTHGSAAQRQRWFRNGLSAGRLEDCDTFAQNAP